MERKECANGLQLIKVAAIKLKGNFSAIFMGTLAMTTPLILIVFIAALMSMLLEAGWILSIGIILFVLFAAPLQMGYMKYFNDVLDGKQPRISEVYSYLRFSATTLRAVYISGLLIIMYLIGGMFWMVPAGFAISFFSMTLFFLQKFEYPRLSQAMRECATKMIGNRLAMFAYKLIFYFVYFMLFLLLVLCFLLIRTLAMDSIVISWIVAVCSAIVFIFMYTMITVYFHSSNQIFFEDVLSRDEKKRQAKVSGQAKTVEHFEENKAQENVKSENLSDIKQEEKEEKTAEVKNTIENQTTTKTSQMKKTTTKKSTSTKAKAATKKQTSSNASKSRGRTTTKKEGSRNKTKKEN